MNDSPQSEATTPPAVPVPLPTDAVPAPAPETLPKEIGGRTGPEPTRYQDWEKAGRCIDF